MASEDTVTTGGAKCCKIRLNDGVLRRHMVVYSLVAFLTFGVAVSSNSLQPYLLSNFLLIDEKSQGEIGATAKTLGEVMTMLSAGTTGLLSDKVGRRNVYACGVLVAGVGLALLPLSTNLPTLYVLTALNTLGTATSATMMATIPGDYAVPADRGKANGMLALMNGLGALAIGLTCGRLPGLFHETPFATTDGRGEGRCAYYCMALLAVATSVILSCGMAGIQVQGDVGTRRSTMLEKLHQGLGLARKDVKLAFACLVAAVARADGQMTALFIPQWCVSVALKKAAEDAGLPSGTDLPEEQRASASQRGSRRGSTCVGVIGIAGMVAGLCYGRVVDRARVTSALIFALMFSTIAYGALSMCYDPFESSTLIAAFFVGLSQISTVVSSQAFVQQHAPAEVRGAILGLFATCGGLGQIVNVFIGGQLFTHWRMTGPFLWMCLVNLAVVLCGLALYKRLLAPSAGTRSLTADDRCEEAGAD